MDKRIDKFLKSVCSYIKNKDIHKEVSEELESHIFEIIDEYKNSGLNEEKAVEKAILRMGEPSKIGKDLNKIHKTKIDWISITIVCALMGISLITLYSIEINHFSSTNNLVLKKVISFLIGGVISLLLYFFDYKKLQKYSFIVYVLSFLALLFLSVFGTIINGIRGYVLGISIMDIIVPIMLISISGIISYKNGKDLIINSKSIKINIVSSFFTNLKLAGIFTINFITIALIAILQRIDLLLMYIIVTNIIFIASKYNLKDKVKIILSEISFYLIRGALVFFSQPYRKDRILAFVNPEEYSEGYGYIYLQIKNVFNSVNLLEGNIENSFMVEAENNLILNYGIRSFGLIAIIVVVTLILLFLINNYLKASRVKEDYGKLLSLCIISIFTFQCVVSVLFNIGLSPISCNVPFISSGMTNTIMSMLMLGSLFSITKRKYTKMLT